MGKSCWRASHINSIKFSDLKMLPFLEYIAQCAETLQDY